MHVVRPQRFAWFTDAWRRYLELVARRQTEVMLALVYVLLVVPTAAVRRILGRPSLFASAAVGWIAHRDPKADDVKRMF